MIGIIHRRADKVIHRSVQNKKLSPLTLLNIDNIADQNTRVTRNQPPRFDLDFATQIA